MINLCKFSWISEYIKLVYVIVMYCINAYNIYLIFMIYIRNNFISSHLFAIKKKIKGVSSTADVYASTG